MISYGNPDNRMLHFDREHLGFDVEQDVVYPESAISEADKRNKKHYVYICIKEPHAQENDVNWPKVEEYLVSKIFEILS